MREIVIDSFAGGGGASLGIAWATGRAPDFAINHDATALAMHETNHPSTTHIHEDVWKANPRSVAKGRKVGLLWASPDCKHFSRAKGSKPVEKKIRSLAWVVCKWASSVRPRVIILENVREFEDWGPLDANKMPCKARKGLTFRRFVGRLRNLGYAVEWRTLNAADFGAPTHRRRLFLIARRDSRPIKWPYPTHAAPKAIAAMVTTKLKPWRTAAECIDWSLPCPSIFTRKKPLAEKTMRRIALGVRRYVLEAAEPFIVPVTHTGERRIPSIEDPLPTITTAKRGELAFVSPTLIQTGYGEREGQAPRVPGIEKPLGSVVAGGAKHAVVSAYLAKHFGGMVGVPLETPLPTTTAKGCQNQVVSAFLSQYHHAKTENDSRCIDPSDQFRTLDTQNRYAEVAAFLTKFRGDCGGIPIDTPMPTVTSGAGAARPAGAAHAMAVTAANLVHLNHGEKQWSDVEEPLRTQTAGGNHAALVYAFLVKYFGTAIAANLLEPSPTSTSKDRFGLVTVTIAGALYVVADIGMRMLSPRELARAQGFPDTYELPKTKSSAVAKIGNSVCPIMAKVLVEANYAKVKPPRRKAVHV